MSINDLLKSSKAQGLELKIEKILSEIANVIPQGKTIDVGGVTYTVDELVKKLLEYKAFFSNPRETRASLRQMVVDRKHAAPEVAGFLNDLKSGCVGVLGRNSTDLEKLGYLPRKPARKRTVDELAQSVEKARHTREAHQPASVENPSTNGPTK